MAGLQFEMPNLLNFRMGELYYGLILEVIDELEPRDVPELMKADRRFRLILLHRPVRIFGKQIHTIDIYESVASRGRLSIGKFSESTPLHFDPFSRAALFVSKVERCSALRLDYDWPDESDNEPTAFNEVLDNLKQAEVTNRALFGSLLTTEGEERVLSSLIIGSLQNCKMFSFNDYLAYNPTFNPTLHSAFSKVRLELLVIRISPENVRLIMELILNSGIPSENKEAACFVPFDFHSRTNDLIKNFPGILQPKRSNRIFTRDIMIEMLREHKLEDYYRRGEPIYFYWKRIDENRECIYAVSDYFFFAKYVRSIQ